MDISMNQYQQNTSKTAIYPKETALPYLALGLVGEAGEVSEKIKKVLRGDYAIDDVKEDIAKELGDVLWYAAQLSGELGFTFEEVATLNLEKLMARKANNTLHGEGDDR